MPTANQQETNLYYFDTTGPMSFGRKPFYLSKEKKHRQDHRKMMRDKWDALTPDEQAKLQESFKTMREHEDYR